MTINDSALQLDPTTRDAVARSLKIIIIDVLELELEPQQIIDDTNLFDLGIDSLAVLRLLTAIQEHFAIEIPEAALSATMFERFANLVETVAVCG
jgi:acyl carrier protein